MSSMKNGVHSGQSAVQHRAPAPGTSRSSTGHGNWAVNPIRSSAGSAVDRCRAADAHQSLFAISRYPLPSRAVARSTRS
jgi:hypothetical protein